MARQTLLCVVGAIGQFESTVSSLVRRPGDAMSGPSDTAAPQSSPFRPVASGLTQSLKAFARELGFAFTGACPAVEATGFPALAEWLDRGFAGEMDYLAGRRDAYRHPH